MSLWQTAWWLDLDICEIIRRILMLLALSTRWTAVARPQGSAAQEHGLAFVRSRASTKAGPAESRRLENSESALRADCTLGERMLE